MTRSRTVFQALRPHDRHMYGRSSDHETLVGADVRCRLRPPDVLFARLQGQHETFIAVDIDGSTNNAPWHLTHQRLGAAEKSEIWPARGQRCTQWLAITTGDVSALTAPLTRWFQHRNRQWIGDRDHQRVVAMGPIGDCIDIFQRPEKAWLLNNDSGRILTCLLLDRIELHGTGAAVVFNFDQLDILTADDRVGGFSVRRMNRSGHQDPACFGLAVATDRHQHRFGQGRGAVVERSIGNVHIGQGRHHALVFVSELQRALGSFGLVRRVGGVIFTSCRKLPDCCGNMVLVGTRPDKTDGLLVFSSTPVHQL